MGRVPPLSLTGFRHYGIGSHRHVGSAGGRGGDGHPRRGRFLSPGALPSRMFAGGEVRFPSALTVGEIVHRDAEVLSTTEKTGAPGAAISQSTHGYTTVPAPLRSRRYGISHLP